jgi:hypothetical protein
MKQPYLQTRPCFRHPGLTQGGMGRAQGQLCLRSASHHDAQVLNKVPNSVLGNRAGWKAVKLQRLGHGELRPLRS